MNIQSSFLSKALLVFILSLGISGRITAGELKGVKMPDEDTVKGKKLILNGMGLREKEVVGISIKVYVAGLYLEKKSQNGDEILKSDQLKEVRSEFLRRISVGDLKKAWQ